MAKKANAGRPTKYKEEYAHMAEVVCSEGPFTDKKLATLFKVAKSTINEWKKDHPEFKAALVAGKDIFDTTKVEKSFLKRCVGYKFTEITREPVITKQLNPDGTTAELTQMQVTKRVTKHVVPDAKGCLDWLSNRAPDRWRKAKHVEITGKDGGPVKTESLVNLPSGPMSIEDWEAEVRAARTHDKPIDPAEIPGVE